MNILATNYTLSTKSLDIYLAGCTPPHCEKCHNPESWDFESGEIYDHEYRQRIYKKIAQFEPLIDRIFILGGEPLDHVDIGDLVKDMFFGTVKEIWLFTRYELHQISPDIKDCCDYIKTGRYDSTKLSDNYVSHGIKLASTNQRVWSRKEIHEVQGISLG